MHYKSEVIDEVREKNDIVSVISEYLPLERSGTGYMGICPFHPDKNPSLSVSPDKQLFHCFGCQASGSVFTFIMNYHNCDFNEAVERLAERAGIRLSKAGETEEEQRQNDERTILRNLNKEAARYFYASLFMPQGKRGLDYFLSRGLTRDTIARFGLGFSGRSVDHLYRYLKKKNFSDEMISKSGLCLFDEQKGVRDRFFNRVMYPIIDANSKVIGFGGRVMGDAKPKYLNSPENLLFNKRKNLYALNFARRSRTEEWILCEGYMDVISLHQAGFTNAVASLGTALTEEQCRLLSRFTKKLYLLYDRDAAGIAAALRAIPMLKEAGIEARVANLEPCKDPDEFLKKMGVDAFRERLKKAENSLFFQIEAREKNFDLQDPQGRSDFLNEVAVRLNTLNNEIERDAYTDSIAERYGVNAEVLRRAVKDARVAGSSKGMIRAQDPNIHYKRLPGGDSFDQAQRLMLAWLVNRPSLTQGLREVLGPEDFLQPLYREVADLIYKQAQTGRIESARIVDHFPDAEEGMEVSNLLQIELHIEPAKRVQALTEVLCTLKEAVLQKKFDTAMTAEDIRKLTQMKQVVARLKREGLPSDILQS